MEQDQSQFLLRRRGGFIGCLLCMGGLYWHGWDGLLAGFVVYVAYIGVCVIVARRRAVAAQRIGFANTLSKEKQDRELLGTNRAGTANEPYN